jgi:ATP-dependent RNA helicase DeaD
VYGKTPRAAGEQRPPRERSAERAGKPPKRGSRPSSAGEWETARLYIGAGRHAKIRPGDIVGAIANEARIDSSKLGAIEIYDKFSLVEVPESMASEIVTMLKGTTIKGKRVPIRLDRDQ